MKAKAVIGRRMEAAERNNPPLPGSVAIPCVSCGLHTWISPDTQDKLEESDVWCSVCGASMVGGGAITRATYNRLRALGLGDKEVIRLVAAATGTKPEDVRVVE